MPETCAIDALAFARRVAGKAVAAALVAWLAAACAATETMPRHLAGKTWLAEDIGGAGVIDALQSTVAIAEDGGVSGFSGCNRFSGKAVIDGAKMRFGPLASTRRACAPAVNDQEQKFLAALQGTRSYRLDGAFLFFLDESGNKLMRLTER